MTIKSIGQLLFLLILISSGCTKKNVEQPLVYQYIVSEFNRDSLFPNNFMLTKHRFKYLLLNDSMIFIYNLVDSVRYNDSSNFRFERQAEKNDSLFLNVGSNYFTGTAINKGTKVLMQYSNSFIDTLDYYCYKTYNGLKIYTFYCSSCRAMDSGYNIYLGDSIGLIATYSGPWHMITLLDSIYNSDILNIRFQGIKNQLMSDSLFFPIPFECFDDNNKVKYTPPTIIEE